MSIKLRTASSGPVISGVFDGYVLAWDAATSSWVPTPQTPVVVVPNAPLLLVAIVDDSVVDNVGTTPLVVLPPAGLYRVTASWFNYAAGTGAETADLNILWHTSVGVNAPELIAAFAIDDSPGLAYSQITFYHDGTTDISYAVSGVGVPGAWSSSLSLSLERLYVAPT